MKKSLLVILSICALVSVYALPFSSASAQVNPNRGQAAADGDGLGWPRKITNGDTTVLLYDPQVDKWQGNQIEAFAAVAVQTGGSQRQVYGQVYFTAQATVDRSSRTVTLEGFRVTRGNFPTASDKTNTYLQIIQQAEAGKVETVPQDQILSDLAIAKADRENPNELKNAPPRIIFSTKPALLVLIDGQPVLRPAGEGNLQRIINTRALILFDRSKGTYYLAVMDGWVQAPSPEGPWTFAANVPMAVDRAKVSLAQGGKVDLLTGEEQRAQVSQAQQGQQDSAGPAGPTDQQLEPLKERLNDGTFPVIYVSTVPAELLTADGDPQFKPVPNTGLLYVANSDNQIFMNTANQNYYVLVSGRWFAGRTMNGPWQYVDGANLPQDFANIPEADPKASALASVPGTAASQEAAIENQIPETAAINRQQAQLNVEYDGQPEFRPIPGTRLQYAVNSGTPVLQVGANDFRAIQDGVWFASNSPEGPWQVATDVPPDVYSIPPSSPMHSVTYARIYGSTDDTVYCGYTPGYYGTVVEPDGCVAYGTGWYYPPYIGSAWYGYPWTYGCGLGFGWSPWWGWGFGFGVGFWGFGFGPWWGPFGFGFFPRFFGFGFGFGFGRFGFGRFGFAGFRGFNAFSRFGGAARFGARAGWGGARGSGFARGGFANRGGAGINARGANGAGRGGNSFGGARGGNAMGGARGNNAFGGARGNNAFGGARGNNSFGGSRGNAMGGSRGFGGSSGSFGSRGGSSFGGSRGFGGSSGARSFGGSSGSRSFGGSSGSRSFGGSRGFGGSSGASRGGSFGGSRSSGGGGGHFGGGGGGHSGGGGHGGGHR
jgi:hypothetical protein